MSEVDLTQLAVDRSESASTPLRIRRHVLTRYALPALLMVGFASLVGWASWELIFPPQPVTVIPVLATQAAVQQEGTPLFSAAGWIEPRPTPVRVAALAPGVVDQLLVVEDQEVHAGQPIAELVKDDAQLAYEGALADQNLREAERQEAESALAAAKTRLEQPVHLEADLGAAQAALAKSESLLVNLPFEIRRAIARLEFAQSEYQRNFTIKDSVAKRDVDQAKSDLESAKAMVEELQSREASLQKEIAAMIQRRDALKMKLQLLADETQAKGEAEAKVKASAARVEQARVAAAEAKLRLDRMTIRAPIDGRVFRLVGHPGARVGGEMKTTSAQHDGSTIVTLYRPDMLQVRVDVRFEDIPKVSLGQPVHIDNPALAEPLAGNVLFVSSEADIQKNTLQVKVAISAPPPVFKPEMLVDVTFLAPKLDTQVTEPTQKMQFYLPQAVIHQHAMGSYVWVADQSARIARQTPITTGAVAGGGLIQITSGVSISSRVIVSGVDGLKDGSRIHVSGDDTNSFSAETGTRSIMRRTSGGKLR